MSKVTLHEAASAEVNEAAKYYEERVPGLGLLFLAAVEEATEKVLANPEAFQLVGDEIRHKLMALLLGEWVNEARETASSGG